MLHEWREATRGRGHPREVEVARGHAVKAGQYPQRAVRDRIGSGCARVGRRWIAQVDERLEGPRLQRFQDGAVHVLAGATL